SYPMPVVRTSVRLNRTTSSPGPVAGTAVIGCGAHASGAAPSDASAAAATTHASLRLIGPPFDARGPNPGSDRDVARAERGGEVLVRGPGPDEERARRVDAVRPRECER